MFLICYETEKNADIVANPQKLIEYLSVGNVIVSSLLLDHSANSDLVLMAKQNKELPALFKQVQKEILHYNTDELRKKRVAFALDHTYEKQLQKLEKIVSENDRRNQ